MPQVGTELQLNTCTRCSKRLSPEQRIHSLIGKPRTYCLDCVLSRYRKGEFKDTDRVEISVDLLGRLEDGIL